MTTPKTPQDIITQVLKEKKENTLNRRDALKLMAISPIAASVLASSSIGASSAHAASDAKGKIIIVGGGAGAIMAVARLNRAFSNPDITIIAPNEVHLYQPGQVFIAAGEYSFEDIVFDNNDFIPSNVEWIKDEVASFDPDNNSLITRANKKLTYDYLVVAAGLNYHYEKIEGLRIEDIGTNGISSVYLNDLEHGTAHGAEITFKWFNEVNEASKKANPTVVYTQPSGAIKCGGAPQKILYLSADYLKQRGQSANYIFATAGGKLFGLDNVARALGDVQTQYDSITNKFKHNLVKMDVQNKIATFEHKYEVKGEYDKDLEMYDTHTESEMVEIKYDFIHVVPPMGPAHAVAESKLGWQKGSAKGYLEVDSKTLQHRRYKNVFGIGDICGIPKGKTGGSARHHGPVMVDNLIAQMENKALKAEFDGYTVCPLKVEYGKIIMAEFNYDGPAPSMPFMSDISQKRWLWWAFDLYMLKPMYQYLMMRGLM